MKRWCERWSFATPLLCYLVLFCTMRMLSVPLKPQKKREEEKKAENTLEVNIKNSNFNSDGVGVEERNEYLVNVNDGDNRHKDQGEILQDVFNR